MDKKSFDLLIKSLMEYSRSRERWYLREQIRNCEHCDRSVANPSITCSARRLGTPMVYFKHQCDVCSAVIYDGSLKNPIRFMPGSIPPKPKSRPRPKDGVLKKSRKPRAVQTPLGSFESLTLAAQAHKRRPGTIFFWIQRRPEEFFYLDE